MIRPPVLCYHRIGGPPELGITRVQRDVFVRQMIALAKAGWRTVTLEQFIQADSPYLFPVARLSATGRNFLLTFDDGYDSLAEYAYPVLADVGFTATTFLVTDFVGRQNLWDVRYTRHRLTHLDWPAIETWRARGFDFGSHAATHRRLTWLKEADLVEELGRSRETLIRRLGTAAGRAVAYPFGATNRHVVEIARQTGFELGFAGVWEGGSGDRSAQPGASWPTSRTVAPWERASCWRWPERCGGCGRSLPYSPSTPATAIPIVW
jgi:peptidoglycan/xylan/chitin deacetylase (PgdA/CDA1 family)